MSFAYLPWYTGDYRRDTADLTLLEHGIYLLLIAYCWDSRGPVPTDEARAARIVGATSDDERIAVKGVLNRYFVRHDDGWYNQRLDREIARANAISGARSEAGRTGASKRYGKRLANAIANAEQLPLSPPPPLSPALAPPQRSSNTRPAKHGSTLPTDWRLPDDWLAWAIASTGWDRDHVLRVSLDFRDYWWAKAGKDATKRDWLATWRRWIRTTKERQT